jgi:hypothetical protein
MLIVNEPMFHEIRLVSVTPRDMEVETIMYSRKTETTKNTIIAASPVVPVHLKKYCFHPAVCFVVKAVSHHD